MKNELIERYAAIVALYWTHDKATYDAARNLFIREIGEDAVQELADAYEETRIQRCEAEENYR